MSECVCEEAQRAESASGSGAHSSQTASTDRAHSQPRTSRLAGLTERGGQRTG